MTIIKLQTRNIGNMYMKLKIENLQEIEVIPSTNGEKDRG